MLGFDRRWQRSASGRVRLRQLGCCFGSASVRPVTHATAAHVEEQWAELTSPEELEALRASLLRLLTKLKAE